MMVSIFRYVVCIVRVFLAVIAKSDVQLWINTMLIIHRLSVTLSLPDIRLRRSVSPTSEKRHKQKCHNQSVVSLSPLKSDGLKLESAGVLWPGGLSFPAGIQPPPERLCSEWL